MPKIQKPLDFSLKICYNIRGKGKGKTPNQRKPQTKQKENPGFLKGEKIMAKTVLTIGKGEGNVTATKAKAILKADLTNVILDALRAYYGEDAASMLRVVSPTTGKGEDTIGVICGDFTEDGTPYDAVCTIKLTAKEWVDRVGTKQTKPAFDFEAAKKCYDDAQAEKKGGE